jgi:DNA-binding CsgD family transcriptional regulator
MERGVLSHWQFMRRVAKRELARLSAALAELYVPAGIPEFRDRMFSAMRELIAGEHNMYNEFGDGHFVGLAEPAVGPDLTAAFVAHINEHPSLQYVLRTGAGEPCKFSDFLSLREFRETGIYREFFCEIGIDRQLGGVFEAGRVRIGYAFNRGGKDYGEEDRLLAALFSSHLPRARRNAELWSACFGGGAGTDGAWVLEIDATGQMRQCPEAVRRLFRVYFADTGGNKLPDLVARWMGTQQAGLRAPGDAPMPAQPLCVESVHGRLGIYYSPKIADGRHFLLLHEKTAPSPQRLRSLGLTSREAEVLYWVSEGKRSEEIAMILGSSARTVSKHLEHIFSKLGVETRSAAGAVARRVLG